MKKIPAFEKLKSSSVVMTRQANEIDLTNMLAEKEGSILTLRAKLSQVIVSTTKLFSFQS